MSKKIFVVAIAVLTFFSFWGCVLGKKTAYDSFNSIEIKRFPQNGFYDLRQGLKVIVLPTQPSREIEGHVCHFSGKEIFTAPISQYVRSMGFSEMSVDDYKLVVVVNRADLNLFDGGTSVDLSVSLQDPQGKEVFSQNNLFGYVEEAEIEGGQRKFNRSLGDSFTQALEQINWNRIASFLRTEQQPKDEPQKQVQGLGDTALEQTIIRWDVQSRPQGADIFWRVVSKTPEVKSTNNKYLQTTPYEATKALDIKGLTHENSSKVRIILRCEKDGYLSQEKEYDVRMIMDQEEISAFFRLVKEE